MQIDSATDMQALQTLESTTPPERSTEPKPVHLIKRALNIEIESRHVRRDFWFKQGVSNLSQQYIHESFQQFTPYYASAFSDIKIIRSESPNVPPIFSLYKAASDTCFIGTASIEGIWAKVGDKLDLFTGTDDLAIFAELAYAHEIGHCIAFKYLTAKNKRWSLYEREMFSDAYAVLHIERWMTADKEPAFQQLSKLRRGGPPDPGRPTAKDIDLLKIALEQIEYEQIAEFDFLYQAEQALHLLEQLQAAKSTTPPIKERNESEKTPEEQ